MDTQTRLDSFEIDDQTALICCDVPEMQRIAVEQLGALGYKIHTGLFIEDILLKLHAHAYHVVIIAENFGGMPAKANPVLAESVAAPAVQRRGQYVVLVGASLETANAMQALSLSVDLVVSLVDLVNLRPLVRRGVSSKAEFYAPLRATLLQEVEAL